MKHKGFTLIEMILVITISVIVFGIAGNFLANSFNAYYQGEGSMGLNQKAVIAMMQLENDISLAASLASITSNNFEFTTANGDTINYSLSSGTLNRSLNGAAAQPLVAGISALTFSYYDASGAVTATAANVKLVGITFTLTVGTSMPIINYIYLRDS